MLNPLYTENYNHNVLISSAGVTITYKFTLFLFPSTGVASSAGVTITYKFTSFSLNPLLMRRL